MQVTCEYLKVATKFKTLWSDFPVPGLHFCVKLPARNDTVCRLQCSAVCKTTSTACSRQRHCTYYQYVRSVIAWRPKGFRIYFLPSSALQNQPVKDFADNLFLYHVFFWMFPRRLSANSRRFGTLYRFHLQRQIYEVWQGLGCVGYLYLGRYIRRVRVGSLSTRTRLIYLPPPNHPQPATHLPIGSTIDLPEPGPV
jgi:hypothetical protein